MECIYKYFGDDFFYWYFSTLVQAFAAMIAVLGMLLIHVIQIRRKDKDEYSQRLNDVIIDNWLDSRGIKKHATRAIKDIVPEILIANPSLYLSELKIYIEHQIKEKAFKEIEHQKNQLISIRKSELKSEEVDSLYREGIQKSKQILYSPFLLLIASIIFLFFSNILKVHLLLGFSILVAFTFIVIIMIYFIMRKSIEKLKNGKKQDWIIFPMKSNYDVPRRTSIPG